MSRSEINRLLAKCLAYHDCGKPEQANFYAAALLRLLRSHGINPEASAASVEASAGKMAHVKLDC